MTRSRPGSARADRAQRSSRNGDRRGLGALMGLVLVSIAAPASAEDVVIRRSTRLPVLLDVLDPFGHTALVKPNVTVRPIVGPGVVGALGPWKLTNQGTIRTDGSVHNAVDLFGGKAVNNTSTGVIDGARNGVYISSCSCTPANVTNAGSIGGRRGNGVELDVPGTVTNSGVITGGSTAAGASGVRMGSGSVTNSGSISGSRAGISATGPVTILNRGVIGGGSFALELGAGNDQVTLDTGSVLNGVVEGGGGTDSILLIGRGEEDGPFQNFESLLMQGTHWTLAGISSIGSVVVQSGTLDVTGAITGTTQVTGGTLNVNGSVSGSATVNAAGRLTGSGTVGPLTNFGTVAPGNSIGTLNVAGAFTSAPGSTFAVEVNQTGQSDRIDATGAATLNGGTVLVTPDDGTTGAALDYTILTAAGGVTGTFSNLVENFPFLDHRLTYLPTSVLLTGFRNNAGFESVATCPNQFETARGLDAAEIDPSASGDMDAVVANLVGEGNVTAARRFLDEVGAVSRPDVDFVNLQSLRALQDAITTRSANLNLAPGLPGMGFASSGGSMATDALAGGSAAALAGVSAAPDAAPATDGENGAWLRGIGLFGNRNSGSCPGQGYQYDLGGAALGIDRAFGPAFAFGAAFATGNSNAQVKSLADNLHALHAHGALYGAWTPGYGRDVRVTGVVTGGWIGNDTSRSISAENLRRQALGDFGSVAISGAAEASGIAWSPGGYALRPRAGLRYFRLGDEAYTENSADALDLVVRNHQVQSLRSEIGGHVGKIFTLGGGWSLEPGLEALWSYELLSVDQTVDARFTGSSRSGFEIIGDRPDRNRALVGAGLVARLATSLTISARYLADLSGDETSQSVQAGVRWQW